MLAKAITPAAAVRATPVKSFNWGRRPPLSFFGPDDLGAMMTSLRSCR
jgi:hypothetical protein